MEIKDGSYFLGIWLWNHRCGNDMLTVYRDTEWQMVRRIRIYLDNKAFDSEDIKHWRCATRARLEDGSLADEAMVIEEIREIVKSHPGECCETLIQSDVPEIIMEKMQKIPGMHIMRMDNPTTN